MACDSHSAKWEAVMNAMLQIYNACYHHDVCCGPCSGLDCCAWSGVSMMRPPTARRIPAGMIGARRAMARGYSARVDPDQLRRRSLFFQA